MYDHAEDLSSIAPSVAATGGVRTLSRQQQYQNQPPVALLIGTDDDDNDQENTNTNNNRVHPETVENVKLVRQLPDDLLFTAGIFGKDSKQKYSNHTKPTPQNHHHHQHHTDNVRRLRHNHVGISFGSTVPQAHLAACPVLNDELDDIATSAEKLRKCTCTRKAPMLNLRREIATMRSNEDRHLKTQSEQLRQYKDEAKHLAKVSRAFRDENSRLQRVLEEKSRVAADAEDRRAREKLRVSDIDEKCQNWFVKLDDLRDENGFLAEMSSKSRSEADHLRAALEQAMGENLKLKTNLARQREQFASCHIINNNNQQIQQQIQQQQEMERKSSPSPSMPPSLFVAAAGGLPNSRSNYAQSKNIVTFTTSTANTIATTKIQNNNNDNNNSIGLVEDFNFLRQAVNELKTKCKCSSAAGRQTITTNDDNNNSPSPLKSASSSSATNNNNNNRDCSVPLSSHKYSSATAQGGVVYAPREKVEKAMDQIRTRVHSIDQELQLCRQEEQRWRISAQEMKSILDSQPSSSDKERAEVFQEQKKSIRLLEEKLRSLQQYQQHDYFTSNQNNNNNLLHKTKPVSSNVHSATADVTNLESQLQYAKGQIATLDFQLQTLQKHMNAEMDKLKCEKQQAVALARASATQETENRLRDEIRQTTSGAFLEEMSIKLQQTEKRLQTLEVSHTASEATKRQQHTEIENLRARLERETAIAVQLEPTQRALAQAEKERDAMHIKQKHIEGSVHVLRQSENQCAEEIVRLRERALKAEAEVEELHAALNTATLKLHQEVESNTELRQRLDDTVDRSNSIVRQSKRHFDEQLGDARDKLNQETNQRVNVEARASALECNLRSVREEVERIRRVQLHWS